MPPIKILHTLEVEKEAFYFSNLVDFSDPKKVQHSFVTFSGEGAFTESMRSRGLKTYALNAVRKHRLPYAAFKLYNIIKLEKPDIVHTHLFTPTYLGLLLAKMQGCNTVLTRHHSDALHLLSSKIKRRFYLSLEKQNNRRADHIIAPSRMVREYVVDHEQTPSEKVSTIPYGQTNTRFDAITPRIVKAKRAELGFEKQLSIVCVSRLFHRKGHKYLFEAVAPLFREGLVARIYLVGEGEYKPVLEKLASELGISDRIEFLGWRDDGLEIIAAADIVVHPSLEDALSQSLIESVMLSRPIVATDISGASDTLNEGKYGKLVPPADPESLRSALSWLIENLESARQTAMQGRAYLLKYMSAERVAEEYLQIYKGVLNSN